MAKRNQFNFLIRKFPKRMQKKLAFLFLAVMAVFAILIGIIMTINVKNGDKYTKKVLNQQVYDSRTIPFKRGDIVDRNGTKLATSERIYNLILDVKALGEAEELNQGAQESTISMLVSKFGVDEKELRATIQQNPDSRYQILKKGLTYEQSKEFEEITGDKKKYPNVTGIWLEENYKRTYPYNSLASTVVGFSGSGNAGAVGLESAYNSILNGTDGREYGYLDDNSSLEQTVKEAVNGNTVVSTIDATLQGIVEESILEFNQEHEGEARADEPGSANTGVIVMNPNNGEVLAMANYPNFDPNNPEDLSFIYSEKKIKSMSDEEKTEARSKMWKNFCISDAFEPGSTMKPFTVAAGLETGAITGNETYVCEGSLHVGDYDIHCHLRSGHGTQTIEEAIANSCNVALMQIAEAIGVENFTKYQRIFGFGQYTGIDLPNEGYTASLLYTKDNMQVTDLATNSFGQNFNVTMIQLASGFCSLINGGNYYEPHVVKQIQDEDGNVLETKDPVLLKKTISSETSDQVRQYMKAVVDYGTGTSAQVEGYEIGGKTGTAEKLPRGNGNYLLSFIGYAPVENPEVVIYVVIDEPNVENQSMSSYIMELSQKIMAKAFPYLNITRSESATATGGNGSSQNDYQDYDSSYEDNYSNDSGYYEDESGSYDPDYTDWADSGYDDEE